MIRLEAHSGAMVHRRFMLSSAFCVCIEAVRRQKHSRHMQLSQLFFVKTVRVQRILRASGGKDFAQSEARSHNSELLSFPNRIVGGPSRTRTCDQRIMSPHKAF